MTAPGTSTDDRPTSEVVRSAIANVQELARKELELAKLELRDLVVARLTALVLAVAAAMVALFILAFAGVTLAKALETVWAPWLAWLAVTGLYALVTVILLAVAYRLATRPPNRLERTQQAYEDSVAWARQRLARRNGPGA